MVYSENSRAGANGARICIIGAASMTFIADIVRDMAAIGSLRGSKLVLMDINLDSLEPRNISVDLRVRCQQLLRRRHEVYLRIW